jgi:hypothetical protein
MDYEAYLLGYNPTMHDQPIEQRVSSFWSDGYLDDWWSCANSEAKPGDEFFLLRQGVPDTMKGIVGHGEITSPTFTMKNAWDSQVVMVRFDALTADSEPPIISFAQLKSLPGNQHWSPQRAGIGIRPDTLVALRELWDRTRPGQIESGPARRRQGLVTVREKQHIFRLAVKTKWGDRCALSELAKGFCEVAHILDYAKCETEFEQIDPENGLFLAGHLHQAFDNHLLGISSDGTVLWSKRAAPKDRKRIGPLRRIPVTPRSSNYLAQRLSLFSLILRGKSSARTRLREGAQRCRASGVAPRRIF